MPKRKPPSDAKTPRISYKRSPKKTAGRPNGADDRMFYASGDAVWPPKDGPAPGKIKDSEGSGEGITDATEKPGGSLVSADVPPPRAVTDTPTGKTGDMTLMGHLGELRLRITRALIGAAVGFALCYGVAEHIFQYLALPLVKVMPEGTHFIYTGVAEGFFVYLKIAIVAGIFIASPYIFYQMWAFIAPGLYAEERKHVLPLAIFSAIFFIGGALFCYFGVFPIAFKFFMSYSTESISAMPSLNEYLSFALMLLVAFGVVFEMPLLVYFLARLGVVTAARMRSFRRYAVLGAFIIGALLTPPDVFSQLLMAGPMLILYEISILLAAAVGKKSEPEPEAGQDKNK